MKERPSLFDTIAAGLSAFACCIGPLVLGAIGSGSLEASVSYELSRAENVVPNASTDPILSIAAVEKAGNQASVPKSAPSDEARDPRSRLAGEWNGRLTVDGNGKSSKVIVDLDRVTGRWTGQFDLPDFGVEDYPVDVAVAGRTVTLHLSAAQIEFVGELDESGDALVGVASLQGRRDSLVLRRGGEARLSDEFLRLEALSEDSTRVQGLSASGEELRKQFNQDKAFTRLLMLLSPS